MLRYFNVKPPPSCRPWVSACANATPVSASISPPRGLTNCWLFNDQKAGLKVSDCVGIANGTLNGPPTWSRGRFGSALNFAAGSRVDLPEYFLGHPVSSNTQGSIVGWIRNTDLSSPPVIFSSTDESTDNALCKFGLLGTTGELMFQAYNVIGGYNDVVYTNQQIVANRWYHVVVTCDGSTWRFYINGALQSTSILVGSNSGRWFSAFTNRYYRIGFLNPTFSTQFFVGQIDHIRLYNRPLWPPEIMRLYSEPFWDFAISNNAVSAGTAATNQASWFLVQ